MISTVQIRCGFAAGVAALGLASSAMADPCTAPVTGYAPGATIAGLVRYVGDGDSLCVGPSADPSSWVEIRLANWFAPELHDAGGREAKAALMSIALGRPAVCTVERGMGGRTFSYDRAIARCRVGSRDLAPQLESLGVAQGGRGRR